MVCLKGGGGQPPQASGELSHDEFDLQAYKDATAAKFTEVQNSFEAFCSQQTQFRTDIMEELRQLRVGSKASADQVDSSSLQFGSLPAISSPVKIPATSGTSITRTSSEGMVKSNTTTFRLNLSHNEVILGVNSEMNSEIVGIIGTPVASGAIVCGERSNEVLHKTDAQPKRGYESMKLSSVNAQGFHSQPTQYYQHTNFGSQPFNNFIGPYHAPINSQGYYPYHTASSSNVNYHDPFLMTYSGPYTNVPTAFHTLPTPTLPFAVPTYLNAQATHQSTYVQPTFATTMTHSSNQSFGHHHNIPIPNQPQYNHGLAQFPDNNLPTMKQMRLEFIVYSGGDPVEWLNKAEQYIELYQIPEDMKLSIATIHLSDKASDRW